MSLTKCIAAAGKFLTDEDKNAVLSASATYREQGMSADDAARAAIRDQLKVVNALLAELTGETQGDPAEPKTPKPKKPPKSEQELDAEAIAKAMKDGDGKVIAEIIYKGTRDITDDDIPVVLTDEMAIRLSVPTGERVAVEARMKVLGFRVNDRVQVDAKSERMELGALFKPQKGTMGDAGEELEGGRKRKNPPPPEPKDVTESKLEKWLDSLKPVEHVDPYENPNQTFGAMMFKEAIASKLKYPLAYLAERARNNFRVLSNRQLKDKGVLMQAMQDPDMAAKVETWAQEYVDRLKMLHDTMTPGDGIVATMDALQAKYMQVRETDLRVVWNDSDGARLATILNISAGEIQRLFVVYGQDENSTDQTNRAVKRDADRPPYIENIVRVGMKNHRKGKDITTTDEFITTFGMRGFEFGEWVTQAERQDTANLAYDSLMDLADLLGVDPTFLGLQKNLGFAIGARGKGGNVAAHFEPDTKVINLTKTKGNGTVAHEWFHALDNLLATLSGNNSAARALVRSLGDSLRERVHLDRIEDSLRAALKDSSSGEKRNLPPKDAVAQLISSTGSWEPELLDQIKRMTGFFRDASDMDKGKDTPYWSTQVEMLARGFETYLYDKSKGGSPYLVGPSRADGAMTAKNGYQGTPYPTGDERQYVAERLQIFMSLFDPATGKLREYEVEPRIIEAPGMGFFAVDQHGLDLRSDAGHLTLHKTRDAAMGYVNNRKGEVRRLTLRTVDQGRTNNKALDFVARIDAVMEEMGIFQWPEIRNGSMAESMFFHLRQGWWPKNNPELLEYAAKAERVTPESLRGDRFKLKRAQEDFEAALARYAGQRIVDWRAAGMDDRGIYDELVKMYESQPNLDAKDSNSLANQAYSTPLPIAFLMGKLGRVASNSKVWDSTLGNAMLTITANPANVSGIELDPKRVNNLTLMKSGNVTQGDAVKLLPEVLKDQQADTVLLNPPFNTQIQPVKVGSWDGHTYTFTRVDHAIASLSMRGMADKGRATIVLGAHRDQPGKMSRADMDFMKWIYTNYNVADHFEIAGPLYGGQGATWPIRVLVVAGRKQTENFYDESTVIDRVEDFNQLWSRYAKAYERSESVLVGAGQRSSGPGGANPNGGGVPGGGQGQGGGADSEGAEPGAGGKDRGDGPGVRGGKNGGGSGKRGGSGGSAPGNDGTGGKGPGRGPVGGETGGGGNGGVGPGGAGGPGSGGLGGLTPEEILRLLQQGGGKSSGGGSSGGGRGGSGGGRGSSGGGGRGGSSSGGSTSSGGNTQGGNTPPAGPPSDVDSAAQSIRDKLNKHKNRPAFSRQPKNAQESDESDDTYRDFLPDFERIWKGVLAELKDAAQIIRAFAARMRDLLADIFDDILPFMQRFIVEKSMAERAKPSGKKPIIPDPVDSETQVVYRGRSRGFAGGIYVPRSMAPALEAAFTRFELKHGDIDEFVQKELGYASIEEMHGTGSNGLGGYQVDALGLAIAQMKDGNGFIIGDDTGVGKGRTAAGLITWALQQGKVPIFFSYKKELYSDMWGDLRDIGRQTNDILMTNSDVDIVDKSDGNKVVIKRQEGKARTEALQHIINTGTMPGNKKILFTSYSQVNKDNNQRKALARLVKDGKAVIIMDESHNAAGDSATGEFFDALLNGKGLFGLDAAGNATPTPADWEAPPTTYLSGTFAKRSDNLPVYGRTLLRYAADDQEGLKTLFATGGDTLLKVASEKLVEAGAMIRRERSYEGVKFGFRVDEANAPRDARLVDEVTEVLRQVVSADRAFFKWSSSKEGKNAILQHFGTKGYNVGAGDRTASIDRAMFTSYVHNYIEQLLLATKITSIVEETVASMNRGEKAVIAIKSTMEAAVNDYMEQEGIKPGDAMTDFGWQSVLRRAERSARRVTLKPPGAGTNKKLWSRVIIPESLMPEDLYKEFMSAQALIERFTSTLPASPIDAIGHELSKYSIVDKPDGGILVTKNPPAGSKSRPLAFRDISGKGVMVDYSQKVPVLRNVVGRNNNQTVTDFQDGTIDVALITAAGSTGLSLHASEKAIDQRPRFMVIGQPDADISVFKQKLGRIHRTGQVEWPGFVVLATGIPAERRQLAVLRKKLKTLFSTTSAGKSSTDIDAVDFINIYGDNIVQTYLRENEDVATFLDINPAKPPAELSLVASGRAALLKVDEQEDFFNTIEQQFTAEIEERNASGTNELERRELDLQAEQMSEQMLEEGLDPDNPFTGDAKLSKFRVNILGDVPNPAGVRAAVDQALAGRTVRDIVAEIEKQLKVPYDEALNQQQLELKEREAEIAAKDPTTGAYIASASRREQLGAQIEAKKLAIQEFSSRREKTLRLLRERFIVGGQYEKITILDVESSGVITSLKVTASASKKANPYSPSNFTLTFVRNLPNGRVNLTLSRIEHDDSTREVYVGPRQTWRDNIDDWFRLQNVSGGRELRWIGHGNLLAALRTLPGNVRKEIVKFTWPEQSGEAVDGVLMPLSWQPAADAKTTEGIRYPDAAVDYMLTLWAASLQNSINRGFTYSQGKFDSVLAAAIHFGVMPIDSKLDALKKSGIKHPSSAWRMDLSMGSPSLAVTGNRADIAKALKDVLPVGKKNKDPFFLPSDPNALGDPKKLREVVRVLSGFGPIVADVDGGSVFKPIVRAYYDAETKKDGGKPAASRNPGAPGAAMSVAEVQAVADAATAQWTNAPKIVVVENMDDPRIPQSVRDEFQTQNEGGAEESVDGFFDKGTVYLLASEISSPAQVRITLMHESLGHYGLRGVFGDDFDGILDQIIRAQPARVNQIIESYGLDKGKLDDRRIAAEEVLAFMAQDKPELGFVRRAIAAVRTFLRNLGWREVGLSNDEIIRDYILPARRFVERGPGDGPKGGRPAFSRTMAGDAMGRLGKGLTSGGDRLRNTRLAAGYFVNDFMQSHGTMGFWQKTIGTPYSLARKSIPFKKVYDAIQNFLGDVSQYATEAANLAPTLLPKLDKLADIKKAPVSAADSAKVGEAVFQGTLLWKRGKDGQPTLADEEEQAGIVWTPEELRSQFGMNPAQIKLYEEFRASTDESIRSLAISDMLRLGGQDLEPIHQRAMTLSLQDAEELILDRLALKVMGEDANRSGQLSNLGERIKEKSKKAQDLIDRGYAPLMRFGTHAVDVLDADGSRAYFGLFETASEANKMARQMRANFPDGTVTQGTVATEKYRLFQGVNPETLELFGEILGLDAMGSEEKDAAFQEYIQLAKSTRSAMKRLLKRKGIAGFSDDAGRVLAGFVYSSARQTSANLHQGSITRAVNDIPKSDGELTNYAVQMSEYVRNPQEEAQGLRSVLFAQYIGGSVASALVNMTQPIVVSFPYLSRFGGARKAASALTKAMADMAKGAKLEAGLEKALREAEEDGTVSPQEVFQLMAQARGSAALKSGDGTKAGNAAAAVGNGMSRVMLAWGKLFGFAEQVNRRATFIAAYRMAPAGRDPFAFAKEAVTETQFTYNKGNRPRWARGVLGSLAFTFKTYSISYVELLARMASDPDSRRALLYALALMVLMAGVDELPFMQDVEDVVDGVAQRLGYDFSLKQARNGFLADMLGEELAEFVAKGVSGIAGMPIDLSGRLGMGDLIPGTGVFLKKNDYTRDAMEVIGPAGDFIQRAAKSAGLVIAGDPLKALTTISPVAVQNAVKAGDMAEMGMYRDDRGRKVIETTGAEAALKGLGFQPGAVAKVQDSARNVQRSVALAKIVEAEIADLWAAGTFEKDPDKVARAQERLREWNRTNKDTPIRIDMRQIRQRIKTMGESRATRLERSAPPEIRARVREELQ